jgi:hypothetical protein
MRASKGKENWVVGRSRSQQTLNVNGVSNYSGGSVGTRAVSLCVCATRRPGGRPDSSGKELRTLVWVAGHRTRGHSCTNACHTHNKSPSEQSRVVLPRRVAEGASWHPPSHNYIAVLGVLAAIARGQRLAAPCTTHAPMPCHAPMLPIAVAIMFACEFGTPSPMPLAAPWRAGAVILRLMFQCTKACAMPIATISRRPISWRCALRGGLPSFCCQTLAYRSNDPSFSNFLQTSDRTGFSGFIGIRVPDQPTIDRPSADCTTHSGQQTDACHAMPLLSCRRLRLAATCSYSG